MPGASKILRPLAICPDARTQWDGRPVRIRMLVGMAELSQKEVAERLGIGLRALQRYMADSTPQSRWMGFGDVSNLERIAAYRQRSLAAAEGRRRRQAGGVSHA
jgi:transcriptional regulator with XRE-family HTH domain